MLAVLLALEKKSGVIYDDEKVSSGSLLMQVCALSATLFDSL